MRLFIKEIFQFGSKSSNGAEMGTLPDNEMDYS